MFIGLLTGLVSACNHTKCVSLSNQKRWDTTYFNLHSNEYSQVFHYYPFTVTLEKCVRSCNTFNDLSSKVCVPNKTEDLNLNLFIMITGINVLKTLTKHISCEYKYEFDKRKLIQVNGGITINVDVSIKNIIYMKRIIFGILVDVLVKMENI